MTEQLHQWREVTVKGQQWSAFGELLAFGIIVQCTLIMSVYRHPFSFITVQLFKKKKTFVHTHTPHPNVNGLLSLICVTCVHFKRLAIITQKRGVRWRHARVAKCIKLRWRRRGRSASVRRKSVHRTRRSRPWQQLQILRSSRRSHRVGDVRWHDHWAMIANGRFCAFCINVDDGNDWRRRLLLLPSLTLLLLVIVQLIETGSQLFCGQTVGGLPAPASEHQLVDGVRTGRRLLQYPARFNLLYHLQRNIRTSN